MSNKTAIVLVVDGLSAQHMGVYGNTWIDTPQLNRLATCADVWEFAYTPTVQQQLSLESLICGGHPLHFRNVTEPKPGLIESLNTNGVETFFVSDSQPANKASQGFAVQHILQSPKPETLAGSIDQTQFAHSFAQLIEILRSDLPSTGQSLVWIQLKGFAEAWDAPYSLRQAFAHDEDPDPPAFVQPPAFDLRKNEDVDPDLILGVQQAYAAQLQVFDECLGVLLDELNVEQNHEMLVGLTSNRGFPLGEHRLVGQHPEISFGEASHVPLMIRHGNYPVTTFRHQSLRYSFDLLKLVKDWFDGQPDASPVERLGLAICANDEFSLRTPAWYLVRSDSEIQLYVKPDDRWEVNDVASRCRPIIDSILENEDKIKSMAKACFDPEADLEMPLPDELTATMRR